MEDPKFLPPTLLPSRDHDLLDTHNRAAIEKKQEERSAAAAAAATREEGHEGKTCD